jgi:hypothetical protein
VEFEENFTGSSQQCSIPQFEFFEECTIWISVPQYHFPGTASRHENRKKFEDLTSRKVGELRLWSNLRKCNDISARTDISKASQFIADSWRKVSTKTIQNCFAVCGFNHSDFEITWEMHHIENYEKFLFMDSNLQCCDVIFFLPSQFIYNLYKYIQ